MDLDLWLMFLDNDLLTDTHSEEQAVSGCQHVYMCVYVCVCVCVYVCVYMCVCVYVYTCVSVHIHVCVCLWIILVYINYFTVYFFLAFTPSKLVCWLYVYRD